MEFNEWKCILQREYSWLLGMYPLSIPVQPLWILRADDWVQEGKEKEEQDPVNSAGEIFKSVDGGYLLSLSIAERPAWDRQHVLWAEMWGIPHYHLHAFMLYHEYGHLIEMSEIYMLYGEQAVEDMLEAHEELVRELTEQENEKSEEEISYLYRLLPMEEYADRFAVRIYQNRRTHLWMFGD